MIIPKFWTLDVQAFNKKWIEFKDENNIYDFTDLIDECLKNMPYAPGHPEVLFVDEAQDMTKLQLTLIRSWGQQMDWIVLIGDDDQTIYRFTGASPDAFLNPPIEAKMKTVLNQSYRVPRKILERANDLIHKVKNREPKIYSPRINKVTNKEAVGAVHKHTADWRYPNELIDLIEKYDNKSIMFLASCSYMLAPLIGELRNRGLPFHNPYRKVRGDWNPLQAGSTGISSKEMLINFLDSGIDGKFWNIVQFVNWAKYIKVGETNSGIKRKTGKIGINRLKKAIDDNEPGFHTSRNVIAQILTEKGIKNALNRNIEWLMDHLPLNRYQTMQYPFKIFKKSGYDALKKIPQIIPGTIHSVKGAEADIVVLFPDISQQAQAEIDSSIEGFDSIIRTFYVGMTRARQELILTSPAVKYKRMQPRLFIEL
jgi:superfamily I DNA/RNA helicase